MRLVIQKHAVTTRCERCLPNVIELHKDCSHVIEQIDDGSETITLVIRSEGAEVEFQLTPEQIEYMRTEGWEAVLEEIVS